MLKDWKCHTLTQISFLVMYVHILLFLIICLIAYFHIKTFEHVHQVKIYVLYSSQTQTIFGSDFAVSKIANLLFLEKLNNLPPRTSLYTFKEESFKRKQTEKFKELIFTNISSNLK